MNLRPTRQQQSGTLVTAKSDDRSFRCDDAADKPRAVSGDTRFWRTNPHVVLFYGRARVHVRTWHETGDNTA